MRNNLIETVVELSKDLNDDGLEWMNFNSLSNREILEMYRELIIQEYMEQQDRAANEF